MEIDWRQQQIERYGRDAERLIDKFLAGERDAAFLARTLELLRTYLQSASHHQGAGGNGTARSNGETRAANVATDTAVIKLATILNQHLQDLGHWHQIVALWPALIEIAAPLPDPLLYVEMVNQLAIVKDRQGRAEEAQVLFEQILGAPLFAHLSPAKQVNTLIMAGACYLWHGDHARAEQLLTNCLTLCRQSSSRQSRLSALPLARADQFGVHASGLRHPLWQNEGFTLSQLGNLAMFRGDFARAHRYLDECLRLFEANGEGDNLACVAYQALGRLLLYERRFAESILVLERGLAIRRRRRAREHIAANAIYLAAAHLGGNRLDAAERLLVDALPESQALDNRHDVMLCRLHLGQLAARRGDRQEACAQWREGLTIARSTSIPVVELRVWVRWLPWLLRRGEVGLCRAMVKRLLVNMHEQRLSGLAAARLLYQAGGLGTVQRAPAAGMARYLKGVQNGNRRSSSR